MSTQSTPANRSAVEAVLTGVIGKPVIFYDIALVPVGSTGHFSPSGTHATLASNGWIAEGGQRHNVGKDQVFTSTSGPTNNDQLIDVLLAHFDLVHKNLSHNPQPVKVMHQPATQLFDIWTEGYATNEGSGVAQKANQRPIAAVSFDEAVASYVTSLSSSDRGWWVRTAEGKWTMWGCQAFPDQRSAQESFG